MARDDRAFERPVIVANQKLDHQTATIESPDLTRRLGYDRRNDICKCHAYA